MGLNRIVSGNPVEVKHFNYGTTVNYTKVGSPTIASGIVSNFSQNDYVSINSSINIKNITETIFRLYIDTTDMSDNQNFYLLQDGIRVQYFFNKYQTFGTNMSIRIAGANHVSAARNVPTDTWFYLKTTYDGTTYKAFKSLDKVTWEEIMSFDVDLSSEEDTTSLRIGSNQYVADQYFFGSIDLNETYIKKNGELWFFRPCVNCIKKDGTLVFADNILYLAGPSTYTKVGSPTVTDCVMGNFSDSNYATAPYPTTIPTKTECIINFTTGDTITGANNQSILNFVDFLNIEINTSGQLYTYDYTKKQRVGNVNLATNTNYYCKILFENGQKTLSLSTNGVDYTTFANFSDAAYVSLSGIIYFCKHPTNSNRFFKGSIDFKKTYINIDDSLYFYGKNYASKNIAPVPAGFPYGIYAMPSVGYIDMRTQTFTAAPNGATIGRDE